MAETPNRETCPHLVKDLRPSSNFPETWIDCSVCGEGFMLERVVGYDIEGSTARLLAVARALPGLSSDSRPLAALLEPHISVDYARVVQQGHYKSEPTGDGDEEPDLKWGHGR